MSTCLSTIHACVQATELLGGKTADSVLEIKEEDEAKYENIFNEANFAERVFTFRVKAVCAHVCAYVSECA